MNRIYGSINKIHHELSIEAQDEDEATKNCRRKKLGFMSGEDFRNECTSDFDN